MATLLGGKIRMKILLISGHTSGHNKMANGSRNEGDLNIELVKLINSRLSNYVTVEVYPYSRDAYKDVCNGTFTKYLPKAVDYCLEVHFNALNGKYNKDGKKKGTEIFVTTKEKGISVEQKIMKNMSKFFPLRDNDGIFDGVKRENFAVINKLKNLGISGGLLETCFYDDEDDMATYNAKKGEIADAIIAGIVEGFGLKKPSTSTPQPSASYYKKYNGPSGVLNTVLRAIGVPSKYCGNWKDRKPVAMANGISNYEGTAAQNTKLISLAKQGKLKKV